MYTVHVNEYQLAKEKLLEHRCPNCSGLGQCDDAEPGDIYCNIWECKICNGTGLLTTKENDGYSKSK